MTWLSTQMSLARLRSTRAAVCSVLSTEAAATAREGLGRWWGTYGETAADPGVMDELMALVGDVALIGGDHRFVVVHELALAHFEEADPAAVIRRLISVLGLDPDASELAQAADEWRALDPEEATDPVVLGDLVLHTLALLADPGATSGERYVLLARTLDALAWASRHLVTADERWAGVELTVPGPGADPIHAVAALHVLAAELAEPPHA